MFNEKLKNKIAKDKKVLIRAFIYSLGVSTVLYIIFYLASFISINTSLGVSLLFITSFKLIELASSLISLILYRSKSELLQGINGLFFVLINSFLLTIAMLILIRFIYSVFIVMLFSSVPLG